MGTKNIFFFVNNIWAKDMAFWLRNYHLNSVFYQFLQHREKRARYEAYPSENVQEPRAGRRSSTLCRQQPLSGRPDPSQRHFWRSPGGSYSTNHVPRHSCSFQLCLLWKFRPHHHQVPLLPFSLPLCIYLPSFDLIFKFSVWLFSLLSFPIFVRCLRIPLFNLLLIDLWNSGTVFGY